MPKVSYNTKPANSEAPGVAYKILRCFMASTGTTQEGLAKTVGLSPRAMTCRLNAIDGSEWRLNECYTILALFDQPNCLLPVMFPRDPYAPLPFNLERLYLNIEEAKA